MAWGPYDFIAFFASRTWNSTYKRLGGFLNKTDVKMFLGF